MGEAEALADGPCAANEQADDAVGLARILRGAEAEPDVALAGSLGQPLEQRLDLAARDVAPRDLLDGRGRFGEAIAHELQQRADEEWRDEHGGSGVAPPAAARNN